MKSKLPLKPARSIRFRLIVAVNSILFLFAVAFLVYDYGREINDRFDEKKTALEEEAKTLLPGILHLQPHGLQAIQTYVDDVCGRMENAESPNHHIAVDLHGTLIQAHAHHRQSDELVAAMKKAAENDQQRVRSAENDLVVGIQTQGNATVIVSENVSRIRSQVFSDVMRRMWSLALMGLVAATMVNLMLVRMVSRPLQSLVSKVREVGQGSFETQLASFGSAELDYLSAEINAMSDALKASERERKSRLDKARLIQENLLPDDIEVPGVNVGMIYTPAEEVGGDYFDILPHGENGWLICIADATDHGVPAAMTAAMLKTLLLQTKELATSPAEILLQMNRTFMDVNLYGDFASIILLRLDLDTQHLTFANAGHDPAWLIESEGKVHELMATGTLLGIDEDTDWEDETIELSENCRLALSTDGITETFNSDENQFGKQRLLDLLLEHACLPASQTAKLIHENVNEFRGEQTQSDDVTLLLLDFVLKESKANNSPVESVDAGVSLSTESVE